MKDDIDSLCRELQETWHREIPVSKSMDIHVSGFSRDRLEIRAALAPNVNVHGTAFAGSLYAIAALCGWGSTWLALKRRGIDGSIVIADARIRYARPVDGVLIAACMFDPEVQAQALQRLVDSGRTRFDLTCHIGEGEAPAATFEGRYAVRVSASASG